MYRKTGIDGGFDGGEVHGDASLRHKKRALTMKRNDPNQSEFLDFHLPFGGKLKATNRWAKLSDMMPWDEVERCYGQSLAGTRMGAPALSGRMAYGALIIKERLGVTDEEVVEQISENPYLQYFLGLHEYREQAPFDPSMMVHFRNRFTAEHHQGINSRIVKEATAETSPTRESKDRDDAPPPNAGKVLVDATCTPADITYPSDLKLLGEAREKTERYIDLVHAPFIGEREKPRTYRQKARRQYLAVAKQKKPCAKKIRKAIGQQLRYLKRNLGHIATQLDKGASLALLSSYERKCLQVIQELHRQQSHMYQTRTHSVPNRIVSISQPHIRPIVRGKAGKNVEFGAKISLSHLKEGYLTLDRLSWENYNESGDLIGQIEDYRERFGYYPASVHADTIYRTRTNRAYCKEHGIRLSGKALGRPRKQTAQNKEKHKAEKKRQRQDELARIPVEGKFGNAKRKGTLGRIMAKLAHTSESVIHVGIVVLNLDKWLRETIFWLTFEHGRSANHRPEPLTWLAQILNQPIPTETHPNDPTKIYKITA